MDRLFPAADAIGCQRVVRRTGPCDQPEEGVQQNRARGAARHEGEPGRKGAETFPDPPNAECPDNGSTDGDPLEPTGYQAQAQSDLHADHQRVRYGGVRRQVPRRPEDGPADRFGFAHHRPRQVVVPPVRAEEVRLSLQNGVEEPQESERRPDPPALQDQTAALATGALVGATTPPAGSTVTR